MVELSIINHLFNILFILVSKENIEFLLSKEEKFLPQSKYNLVIISSYYP